MPSFVVVAGADVDMADLESGSGISARIDLNLHLAPPVSADFLRLGSTPLDDQQQQQSNHPQRQQQDQQQEQGRRILPRFGPGIHGVFLDLHQEAEPDPAAAADTLNPASPMRPPIRHRLRYSRPPSMIRIGGLDNRSVRLHRNQPPNPAPSPLKEKEPLKQPAGETKEDDETAVKPAVAGGTDRFECNVCLDIAEDPVVTFCGHLFCWQCLYQWLYVHSTNQECPVCKGSVSESSIIPIYGRGSSASASDIPPAASDDMSVPPRPRARRVDSLRQRLEAEGAEFERSGAGDNSRWNLNVEVMRMRRAIRFLHENMMPGRSSRLLRRMSERREHYRSPTLIPPPPPTVLPGGVIAQPAAAAGQEGGLYGDLIRRISVAPDELEERGASIRARLSNLVDTIESHRRGETQRRAVAAAAAAAVGRVQQPSGEGEGRSSFSVSAPVPAGVLAGVVRREVGEGSGTSGSGDVDPSELLRSRKRRRLN